MDVNFHVELVTNDPLRQPFHNRQTKQPALEGPDISANCTNHVSNTEAANQVKSFLPSTRSKAQAVAVHCVKHFTWNINLSTVNVNERQSCCGLT